MKAVSRWMVIFSLVFAGEMIFSLPFHVARFFRPTLLEAINLTNSEFGDILSVYGIMAMLAYFPGGAIADKFSARKLMAVSLFATALGGIYMSQLPGKLGLSLLFGFWGLTTILLFWAAMIKTTREWGGSLQQGRAFGILDGGRGLIAAAAATLAVYFITNNLGIDVDKLTDDQRIGVIRMVIWYYSALTFLAGLFILLFIPEKKIILDKSNKFKGVLEVIRNRNVWLQALIVVSAYCGYKSLDYYSLYGVDILGMNEIEAAGFVSNAAYIRAFAAIIAGLLVDRLNAKLIIISLFIIGLISFGSLVFLDPSNGLIAIVYLNIIITFFAVYALRGVYFALIEETKIPKVITGTAVGLISVIGYTPDIFFNSIAGRLVDASPGIEGYHNFFLMLSVFSIIGMLATFGLKTSNNH